MMFSTMNSRAIKQNSQASSKFFILVYVTNFLADANELEGSMGFADSIKFAFISLLNEVFKNDNENLKEKPFAY